MFGCVVEKLIYPFSAACTSSFPVFWDLLRQIVCKRGHQGRTEASFFYHCLPAGMGRSLAISDTGLSVSPIAIDR